MHLTNAPHVTNAPEGFVMRCVCHAVSVISMSEAKRDLPRPNHGSEAGGNLGTTCRAASEELFAKTLQV